MKFNGKITALLLSLVMILSAFGTIPTLAADGENEDSYVAEVYGADGKYQKEASLDSAVQTASYWDGTVKLLADCTIKRNLLVLPGCEVTLDLNGHKVKRNQGRNMSDTGGSVVILGEKATFTVTDTSAAQNGTIEGGGSKWGGGIYAPDHNIVTMNAGTITNCTAYYGGGVYVDESSKFIMNGGTIDRCYAKYGGGVYVEDKATIETHGGKITHNIAEEDGGGIYVWSAFANLDNCYIGNNHADKGGGIYSDYNSSKMYSYITISGSDIEGNTSQSGYGGIYHNDGGLTLKDGTNVVANYTNGQYGGGVYSEKCSITLGGSVHIFGNTANSYEPCDVSFGKNLDSAFKLASSLSSSSFIGVNSKYHKPKAWYDDMHISLYHFCNRDEDLRKVDPLKDALFSNNLSTGFVDTFYDEDEDFSSTVKKRHYLKVIESGDAVNDRIKVTGVTYKNMPLPQSDFSSTYDPARRTIFLKVPKYVKEYGSLNVETDKNVTFWRGARLATSTGWGEAVGTRYGLVIQNVNESPSYTVSVAGGTVDGIAPDENGISSAQKEFFDELRIAPVVPEGKAFSHWEVEGDYTVSYIIGYNPYIKIPLYLLMPNGNVTFTAVFKDKVSAVEIFTFSPEVGKRTPFYTSGLDYPCLKAKVVYKSPDGAVLSEDTVDVVWKKQQEMFDGTAIHYFDYYANYLASFQIEDTQEGNFCFAPSNELSINLYADGERMNGGYSAKYEYVYGDGSVWNLKNDNNPILQRKLYFTRYYRSEKAPIRGEIPSQITVSEGISKEELTALLPESVNVRIADISYSKGTEQSETKHCPVVWNTENLPDTVTERLEIKGTYNTEKEGFEVKSGDAVYPTLVVVPNTPAMSQMPQVTVDGTPITVIDGTAKIAVNKNIKLTTSMENATVYYKLDDGQLTQYTPDAEIELSAKKDAVTAHEIEAYAQNDKEQSETLKLTIEVDNATTYTVNIVDSEGSEYIYATGAGEYKLGETVSVDLHQKYMDNPWTPSPEFEHTYDPHRRALTWSAKGLVLNDEQKENAIFTFEMPNSNVIIKIDSFKNLDLVHTVSIEDKDGNKYEYAMGAGQYLEGDTVTIDSTQFMLKSMDEEGITTSEKITDVAEVVSEWSAEGITLTDEQKKSSKFEFTMPYNDVTVKAESLRPLVKRVYLSSIIPVAGKPLPNTLEILSATDVNGNEIDKEDVWLEVTIPKDSDFGGMWADLEAGKVLAPGTIAEVGRTYRTFFGIQSSVSGEAAVTVNDYEVFMDGEKFSDSRAIFVATEAVKDELLSVDWGESRELFYSMDDAKASLSSEVKVTTKYGTIDTAKVTWDGAEKLDSNLAYGDFPVTATLTLPNYVEDSTDIGTKQFTIKVRKHIDSVALVAKNGIKLPSRQGDTLPTKADFEISNQSTDIKTVIGNVKVFNKAGLIVTGQKVQAGEEYTIVASIVPNTDYAVLSDNTVFTIKGSVQAGIDNTMQIIGKSENPTSGRSEVYEVSYTFVAQELKNYLLLVNGYKSGRCENGAAVGVTLKNTVGFDHWTAEAVYTTTETVTEGEGEEATTKEITVEHRYPVNPFQNGAEYNTTVRFAMPLLVDDNAWLELTAHYVFGAYSYDAKTRQANIVADKEYSGARVVFACYDELNGRLFSTASTSVDLVKGSNTVTAPEDFEVRDRGKVKIMVWNGYGSITPLFDTFEE